MSNNGRLLPKDGMTVCSKSNAVSRPNRIKPFASLSGNSAAHTRIALHESHQVKRLLVARIQVGQRLTRAERRFHHLEAQGDKLIANAERRAEAILNSARNDAERKCTTLRVA